MNQLVARLGRAIPLSVPQQYLNVVVRFLPIVGAIVFLIGWGDSTFGAWPWGQKLVAALSWAAVLGVAGFFPWAAVIGSLVVLGGEWGMALFLAVTYHAGLAWALNLGATWSMWWIVPIALGYVAATNSSWRLKWAALVAGVIGTLGYAALLVHEGWPQWLVDSDFAGAIVWHSKAVNVLVGFLTLIGPLLVFVVVAWLIGVGVSALWRVRVVSGRLQTTAARLDETDLELKLAHDRGRISRDIHDSLAHSLAIIVAQAEGAAAIHELKPEAAPESLGNIATVARHALGEVRRLVERINDDEDVSEHTSRLEHIPALIDDMRSAGVEASLRVLGEPGALALSKQVAVYRIVQESLTNALKHGGRGATATVTLDAQGTGLAVLVVSKSGHGLPLVQTGGRGIGIAGMKERARLVGGWLTAVPSDDETFVVTAFIPPDAEARGEVAPSSSPRSGGETSDDLVDAFAETALLKIEGARD
ncbi:sensor histidine kinase [Gryllotalpicola reticulitermitis]|uniref:histidine kinase n=1 Tax=Gryllotalpicola reticulitermitis TaxID=1184153 RepID=A0ABV8Q3Y3_9MICO